MQRFKVKLLSTPSAPKPILLKLLPGRVLEPATLMIWLWLLTPGYGLVNYYLGKVGLSDVKWVFDRRWALVAIILVGVWKKVGYYMIIFFG